MTGTLPPLPADWPVWAAGAAVVIAGCWLVALAVAAARRRLAGTPAAVVVTAVAAAGCTAYSGDTSWRFAEHHLEMVSTPERAALFAAGELALVACALMARQSLADTGSPGTPGVLVWVISSVQVIPAFAEGGVVGGLVRAFFGPILAAVLWHLAMGIEIRHARPDTASHGLLATLSRDLRERALSRLGVARRGRDAAQITRDRATARAVALAAHLAALPGDARRRRARTERRLSRAVAAAEVGTNQVQRRALLDALAARRGAAQLAAVDVPDLWTPPEAHPAGDSPRALAGAELRRMHPVDAVRAVADAHPDAHPALVASIATEHGVPCSEVQAKMVIRQRGRALDMATGVPEMRSGTASGAGQPDDARTGAEVPQPEPDAAPDAHPEGEPEHADDEDDLHPDPRLPEAREIDAAHRAEHGRPAGLRILQREMRIGQQRAQRIRAQL
ncbi:hypothetical protein RM844_28590 [Streptomyces sp. DSM 44915]|uniref:Uncharacterized protein n=1 Tax=Streptomyces chisholmiae TaxID=3075540 RepID=A0ABU2JZ03_9ACTN|nr:hypothetical protein [Streptomyces sp. DSM 44915]MDT0270235.1 hypothetical protein [Streptomyces sp. DSM 44915]